MPWRKNKSALAHEFPDLAYLPHGRAAWDCTLSCLAYGMRQDITKASVHLNAWATRHGLPASGSYADLGDDALVLWHGTSRERAERIAEHGLFHKKGLWTARHPRIPHSFCRMRSEQFGTEGAVVCIVMDRRSVVDGRNVESTGDGNVVRFHHGLPPEVVQYVLVREEIRFTGADRAGDPKPWPKAQFKFSSGAWRPVQRTPVRFSEVEAFSTLAEFLELCVHRLLADLSAVSSLEALSVLHSLIGPLDCVRNQGVIDLVASLAARRRKAGRCQLVIAEHAMQSAP